MCRAGLLQRGKGKKRASPRDQVPDLERDNPELCSFPDLGSVCLSKPDIEPCWGFTSFQRTPVREAEEEILTGRKAEKFLSSSSQSQSRCFRSTDFVRFSTWPLMSGCSDTTRVFPALPVGQELPQALYDVTPCGPHQSPRDYALATATTTTTTPPPVF